RNSPRDRHDEPLERHTTFRSPRPEKTRTPEGLTNMSKKLPPIIELSLSQLAEVQGGTTRPSRIAQGEAVNDTLSHARVSTLNGDGPAAASRLLGPVVQLNLPAVNSVLGDLGSGVLVRTIERG